MSLITEGDAPGPFDAMAAAPDHHWILLETTGCAGRLAAVHRATAVGFLPCDRFTVFSRSATTAL